MGISVSVIQKYDSLIVLSLIDTLGQVFELCLALCALLLLNEMQELQEPDGDALSDRQGMRCLTGRMPIPRLLKRNDTSVWLFLFQM